MKPCCVSTWLTSSYSAFLALGVLLLFTPCVCVGGAGDGCCAVSKTPNPKSLVQTTFTVQTFVASWPTVSTLKRPAAKLLRPASSRCHAMISRLAAADWTADSAWQQGTGRLLLPAVIKYMLGGTSKTRDLQPPAGVSCLLAAADVDTRPPAAG